MSARLEKIENSEAHLEIEVDAQLLEEGLDKAYRKVVKQLNVPGFRQGRAPRQLIEAHFGKEILYEDALEFVVPQAFEQAVKELDIEAIAQPEFEIVDIEAGKPLKFNAKVAVKPEVKTGEIEGLAVNIPVVEVKDEDVENRIKGIQDRYAEIFEKTEEPAVLGDTVTINFEGFKDDVPFEGGKGEDYPLELGSNSFVPGFEEQLVGMKTGDHAAINITFPEEYQAPDLAGQPVVFKVEIKKIEGKRERVLDDEFVQEVSEFDTIAEFTADIRKSIEEAAENKKKEFINNAVLEKLLGQAEIEVAPAVVAKQVEVMKNQFEQRITMQGLNLEQFYQLTGSNEEKLINDLWAEALRNLKINFLLSSIAEKKGFEALEEEIDQKVAELAKNANMEVKQARQQLEGIMEDLRNSITNEKAMAYLVEHAIITESDAPAAKEETAETEIEAETEAADEDKKE